MLSKCSVEREGGNGGTRWPLRALPAREALTRALKGLNRWLFEGQKTRPAMQCPSIPPTPVSTPRALPGAFKCAPVCECLQGFQNSLEYKQTGNPLLLFLSLPSSLPGVEAGAAGPPFGRFRKHFQWGLSGFGKRTLPGGFSPQWQAQVCGQEKAGCCVPTWDPSAPRPPPSSGSQGEEPAGGTGGQLGRGWRLSPSR